MTKKRQHSPSKNSEAAEQPSESKALIVVEEIPVVEKLYGKESPKLNQIIPLKKEGSDLSEIPDGPKPFFLFAEEGLFLNLNTAIGRALIKQSKPPAHLKKLGEQGIFHWNIDVIPKEICAQALSFFRRIFDKHNTEAEVILLYHPETKDWKIYVPTQQVSHASVQSVYEPSDIYEEFPGYLIVGTMHSHCDFSAFHSGTDLADAREMSGVHLTLGKIDTDNFEVAAMVMINGQQFTYKDYTLISDWSDVNGSVAPEEWDDKLVPTANLAGGHKPKGYELFEKYKPTPSNQKWTPSTHTTYTPYAAGGYGWADDAWDDEFVGAYFNARYGHQPQRTWRKPEPKKFVAPHWWEDNLSDKMIDAILDSTVMTEEDIDYAFEHPEADIIHWRTLFMQKMARTANVLDSLGFAVEYSIKAKKVTKEDFEQQALLPDDTQKETSPILHIPPRGNEEDLKKRLIDEGFTVVGVLEDGTCIVDMSEVDTFTESQIVDGEFKEVHA